MTEWRTSPMKALQRPGLASAALRQVQPLSLGVARELIWGLDPRSRSGPLGDPRGSNPRGLHVDAHRGVRTEHWPLLKMHRGSGAPRQLIKQQNVVGPEASTVPDDSPPLGVQVPA